VAFPAQIAIFASALLLELKPTLPLESDAGLIVHPPISPAPA
jgi:hypothetical protein